MPTSKNDSKVLIVAAEASSALYAKRLIQHWKDQDLNISAFGIGNKAMEAEGFECLAYAEDLAVVGVQEVISHWPVIKKASQDVLAAVNERKPKFALLLDYAEFNMRLAKKLHGMGIPVVYYISPQLWAWRKGRVKQVQKYIDKMLVLFPFEKEFYNKQGVEVEFVGHPLLDELDNLLPDTSEINNLKTSSGLSIESPLIGLMPGSRRSEIKHNLGVQIAAAKKLKESTPDCQICLFVAPSLDINWVKEQVGNSFPGLFYMQAEPFKMIACADAILSASGTATLMVGLAEKPMVVMYKMNPISAWLAKKLVKNISYFCMVNLIMDKEVVPERFQEKATPEELSALLLGFLGAKGKSKDTIASLREMKKRLGAKGATKRVAKALESYF